MGRTHHDTRLGALGALALAAAALSAGAANADILTFDAADTCGVVACSQVAGDFISQSYGDTAVVDVRYNPAGQGIRNWESGYSGLTDVAYVGLAFGSPAPVGIHLIPISGYQITLHSFDLGSWLGARYNTQVTLRGGDGTLISSTGSFLTNGTAVNTFAPALTRTDGFRIEWGPDSFNVGIDNISFTVTEIDAGPGPGIPEPSAWALMILGFGAAGAMLRRRGQAVAV